MRQAHKWEGLGCGTQGKTFPSGENLSFREGDLLGRDICFKVCSAAVSSDILEIHWPDVPAQPSAFPSDVCAASPSKGWSRMVAGCQEPQRSVDYSLTLTLKQLLVWIWTGIQGVGISAHTHCGTSGFPKGNFRCVVRWESKEWGPTSSPAFGEGFFHKLSCLFDFKGLH